MKHYLLVLLLAFLCATGAGCDRAVFEGAAAAVAGEDEDTFESAEEKRYTLAGRPFAAAIAKQDFESAYAMLSTHARGRYASVDAFRAEHERAFGEYAVPASADEAYVVEMEPAILAGQVDPAGDQMDQAFAKMSIARYVGDVPADVPADIRRAALSASFYERADAESDEARCFYLTYLLVEEAGELKVAHWFYRWHDMLD